MTKYCDTTLTFNGNVLVNDPIITSGLVMYSFGDVNAEHFRELINYDLYLKINYKLAFPQRVILESEDNIKLHVTYIKH